MSTSSARSWTIRAPPPCRWRAPPSRVPIKATDSKGAIIANLPITVASSLGNGLSATSLTTDTQGIATVDYTATNAGTDSLTFTGGGTSKTATIQISSSQFVVRVSGAQYRRFRSTRRRSSPSTTRLPASPQAGKVIDFSTTSGVVSPTSATTNGCRARPRWWSAPRRPGPARCRPRSRERRRRLRCRSTTCPLRRRGSCCRCRRPRSARTPRAPPRSRPRCAPPSPTSTRTRSPTPSSPSPAWSTRAAARCRSLRRSPTAAVRPPFSTSPAREPRPTPAFSCVRVS